MTDKFQSIILGALVFGILGAAYHVIQFSYQSQIAGVVTCCLLPTIGALVATWHYTTSNSLTIPLGEGAVIGLSASLLGYAVTIVLALLISVIGIAPSPFDVEAIIELSRESLIEKGQPDEVIQQSEEITRNFFWIFPVVGIAAYALFGAVVGAIGASVFKKGGDEFSEYSESED
jgi:hypothetical protein